MWRLNLVCGILLPALPLRNPDTLMIRDDGRPKTIDIERTNKGDRKPLNMKTSGSHLELTSPDHSPVKPRSFIPSMNKGFRDTNLSRPTAGSHTAYSPRSTKPNTSNCPVRIGDMASRSQKTGTRFENAFALPGDFMPKHEEQDP